MKERSSKDLTAYGKNNPYCRIIVSAFLGWLFVLAFPSMMKTGGETLFYTNSVLSFLLWLAVAFLLNRILRYEFSGKKRRWLIPGVFAFLFTLCMVWGVSLDEKGSVTFTDGSMWLSVVILTVCFALTIRYFWELLGKKKQSVQEGTQIQGNIEDEAVGKSEKKESGECTEEKNGMRRFFIRALLIFACYLPVFLAVYPGFFVYDAQDELLQVITRNFSTHHPLLHVLLMGGLVQLGYKIFGSYNAGIACYTLFQMAVLSVLFSWSIGRLKKEGMGKKGAFLTTLYFGLCPVVVMFSLCSAKDGLFTGMLLIMVLRLREFAGNPEGFFQKKLHVVLFAGAALGMMLLRHNGFYAFLVFIIALFLFFGRKPVRKKMFFLMGGILAGYLLLNKGLAFVFSADASENQEILTVPIQQLARVHEMEGETLSEEDKNILHEVLTPEALSRYTAKVSDGVKIQFNNEAYSQNPGRYGKLWLKWGMEHPFTYLNAWLMTSYGFWYPDTVIDVYRGNSVFTYTYEDSSYFGFEVEEPGMRESKIPWLLELYRKMSLEIFQQKIPVVSMLFSPGFLFWVWCFILGFFWYRGSYERLAAYLLPMLIFLTVLLGPTYLVRYVIFLWFLLPVLCLDLHLSLFDN